MKTIKFCRPKKAFLIYEEGHRLVAHYYNWAPQGGVIELDLSPQLYDLFGDKSSFNDAIVNVLELAQKEGKILHAKFEMPFENLDKDDLWSDEKQALYYTKLCAHQINRRFTSKWKPNEKEVHFLEQYNKFESQKNKEGILMLFEQIGKD